MLSRVISAFLLSLAVTVLSVASVASANYSAGPTGCSYNPMQGDFDQGFYCETCAVATDNAVCYTYYSQSICFLYDTDAGGFSLDGGGCF